jgi:hypothetical protein
MPELTTRPLYTIAADIRANWPEIYFGAVPYVEAMECLTNLADRFGEDDGRLVVAYFLSNAKTWRGETATRIKNELRVMVGQKPVVPRPGVTKTPTARPVIDPEAVSNARAENKLGAAIVKAAVMRAIFCPYTGVVLDMRRAVVIDTGTTRFVCAATRYDEMRATLESAAEQLGRTIKVYDGRELFTPAGRVR